MPLVKPPKQHTSDSSWAILVVQQRRGGRWLTLNIYLHLYLPLILNLVLIFGLYLLELQYVPGQLFGGYLDHEHLPRPLVGCAKISHGTLDSVAHDGIRRRRHRDVVEAVERGRWYRGKLEAAVGGYDIGVGRRISRFYNATVSTSVIKLAEGEGERRLFAYHGRSISRQKH